MGEMFQEVCAQATRNLRRTIDLLSLAEERARSNVSDLAWLHGARAKLLIACVLLNETIPNAGTLTSVSELILKAETCLAAIDIDVDALSMRIADALLLETRVRIENCRQSA